MDLSLQPPARPPSSDRWCVPHWLDRHRDKDGDRDRDRDNDKPGDTVSLYQPLILQPRLKVPRLCCVPDVVFREACFPPNPWSRPVLEFPRVVVALEDSTIFYLTTTGWKQIGPESVDLYPTPMAVSLPEDCRPPQVVLALTNGNVGCVS